MKQPTSGGSTRAFWSKKLLQEKPEKIDKPERATRQKTKAVKKTAHRKRTTASSNPAPDDEVDNPDFEVELDSLGLFFMREKSKSYSWRFVGGTEGKQAGSSADVFRFIQYLMHSLCDFFIGELEF